MMKLWKCLCAVLIIVLLLCPLCVPANAWPVHGITPPLGKTQGQSWFPNIGNDYPFIDLKMTSQGLTYADNSGHPSPNELDTNGYPTFPLHGSGLSAGEYWIFSAPSQANHPTNYVVAGVGAGTVRVIQSSGGASISNVSCQYTSNGGAPQNGTYTGGGTQSCNVTACTGTCTFRFEFSVSGESTTTNVTWELQIQTINNGNAITNLAFYGKDEEAKCSATQILARGVGCTFGTKYKSIIAQGRFAVWRFLDWTNANNANCTTWATRKPVTYALYWGSEMRASLYGGVTTWDGADNYALTFGSGGPVDKQTIIVQFNANSIGTSPTFNLNSTGAVAIGGVGGNVPLFSGTTPTANSYGALVYDAGLNRWLLSGGSSSSNYVGLNCGVPPEVAVQLAGELGLQPMFATYFLTLDPATDYNTSLASYIKTNYPSMIPRFSASNEVWNGAAAPSGYFTLKANHYAGLDSAWASGNYNNAVGKAASVLCQGINSVYGDPTKYKCLAGVQTVAGFTAPSSTCGSNNNPAQILCAYSYVNQNPVNIPTQGGYVQSAAYNWVNSVEINNYWAAAESGFALEIADAYNYSVGSAGQQATILTSYLQTALYPGYQSGITALNTIYTNWFTWLHGAPFNLNAMDAYEGGYSAQPYLTSNTSVALTGSDTSNPCTVNLPKASFTGSISGTTLSTSGVTGSIAVGQILSGAGIAANTMITHSSGAGVYLVSVSQTVSSEAMTSTANGAIGLSGTATGMSATISGATPSGLNGTYTVASASGNGIALTGMDCTGGALTAGTLTYVGSQTNVNALRFASYNHSLVGTYTTTNYQNFIAAGGTFPSMYNLSGARSATVSGDLWGVFTPDIYATPTAQWNAIANFNFLLKRDLDPASNDNDPMWLEKAA